MQKGGEGMNRSLRGADVRVGGEAPRRDGGTRRGLCGEKSKTWSADFSGFSSAGPQHICLPC